MMERIFILALSMVMITGCSVNKVMDKEEEQPAALAAVPPAVVPTPEPEAVPVTVADTGIAGKTICVDAGHGIFLKGRKEPVAPGSSEMKAAFVSGTAGATCTEEQLNLKVALKLEKALTDAGARVVMTRRTAECELSNVDRAKLANDEGADLTIRLHADGSENESVSGMSVLVPSGKYIKDTALIEKSRKAGEAVLLAAIEATGAKNRGIVERSDMTGFNWSEVPVILLEMGFMTNAEDDKLLIQDEYQDKIVSGIVKGVEKYFE